MNNAIRIAYDVGGEHEVIIEWELGTDGEWDAWRVHPYKLSKSYRLYDLDAIDLMQVYATVQQVLAGDLPPIYLEPRADKSRPKTIAEWGEIKRREREQLRRP